MLFEISGRKGREQDSAAFDAVYAKRHEMFGRDSPASYFRWPAEPRSFVNRREVDQKNSGNRIDAVIVAATSCLEPFLT